MVVNNLNFAGCETEPEVLKPVVELSIDDEFPPVTEGVSLITEPPQTTVKPTPTCMRVPEAGILFTSDNFPGKYLKNTNCTYKMRAKQGSRVQLTFFVFDVSLNFTVRN